MTTDLALPSDRARAQVAQHITQATAVEQARAVAEVQAAIVVAQQMPRDMGRAYAEMREACGRLALANRAFYNVKNRGTGPTVHLMRELARIWGNVNYGVHELRRDDEMHISEVQAFAWDQQTNVRSTRTFQNPHARMARGERTTLTDLTDIYLSNQNIGARAVRECIGTILPVAFVEEAQDICRRTLEHGEGVPLAERVAKMIRAFAPLGVTEARITRKLGRPRSAWSAADVADLAVAHTSITREGIPVEDVFPDAIDVSDLPDAEAVES